jgi:hypothetical protein
MSPSIEITRPGTPRHMVRNRGIWHAARRAASIARDPTVASGNPANAARSAQSLPPRSRYRRAIASTTPAWPSAVPVVAGRHVVVEPDVEVGPRAYPPLSQAWALKCTPATRSSPAASIRMRTALVAALRHRVATSTRRRRARSPERSPESSLAVPGDRPPSRSLFGSIQLDSRCLQDATAGAPASVVGRDHRMGPTTSERRWPSLSAVSRRDVASLRCASVIVLNAA